MTCFICILVHNAVPLPGAWTHDALRKGYVDGAAVIMLAECLENRSGEIVSSLCNGHRVRLSDLMARND